MAEIKCPNCGTVLALEQSDLDSIVRQVRDEEFHRAVEERAGLIESEKNREVFYATYELPKSFIITAKNGRNRVYVSQLAASTLKKRLSEGGGL